MVLRERRKIGRSGEGDSVHVVLPISWVRGNEIRSGTDVVVVYDGDLLVVCPPRVGEAGVRRATRLLTERLSGRPTPSLPFELRPSPPLPDGPTPQGAL